MPKLIGFTGSRNGPTAASEASFRQVITRANPYRFDHGACKGWDVAAVRIVRELFPDCFIVAHPGKSARDPTDAPVPDLDKESLELSDAVYPVKDYFQRNREIVDICEELIGCPPTAHRLERGGTWYTLSHAAKMERVFTIVCPDGSVREDQLDVTQPEATA